MTWRVSSCGMWICRESGRRSGSAASAQDTETFYAFTSFTSPTTIYRLRPGDGQEHDLQAAEGGL